MRFDRALVNVDLYAVLGVPTGASVEQIRRAYRRLVSISHPDLNPNLGDAERKMAQINVAAGVLLDPIRRAAYDRMRSDRSTHWSTPAPAPAPAVEYEHVRLDERELEWIDHLRNGPSRTLAAFDAWAQSWSPEFRMMFLCASVALAVGLIRLANPTSLPSLYEEARPAGSSAPSTQPT